jgi:hypothetical protein
MRPAISEDGKQIAGVDAEQRLVLVSVAGGEPKVIATGFTPTVLRWSHSGKTLLAQADSVPAMLLRVDVETGRCKPWKEIAPLDLAGVSRYLAACLSQDEHTIVYSFLRRRTYPSCSSWMAGGRRTWPSCLWWMAGAKRRPQPIYKNFRRLGNSFLHSCLPVQKLS